jgi:integrase
MEMPRKLPPFVFREKTRHGRLVFYFRRGKGSRIRLPDPGTPEFDQAYQDALLGQPRRTPRDNAPSGSLAWLIARYRESAHFAGLRQSTRARREAIMRAAIESAGHIPFTAISRKDIVAALDRRTPSAGIAWLNAMSVVFAWAVSAELIDRNPCHGVKRPKFQSDGHPVWSVAEVEQFRARWPLGTRERLALDLMLFTGLRRSDIYRLGRQHVTEGLISIRTLKTGKTVYIPIWPELQASIAAAPTGDLTFLTTSTGKPFGTANGFGIWFGKACQAAGVPGRAHGLRKAGATLAADAGASAHELMSLFGWTRLSQAEVYTRQANEKRLSGMASERIANAMRPHLEAGAGNRRKT